LDSGLDFEKLLAAVQGRCGDTTDAECCRLDRFRTLQRE
ncbi:unnamed protein product, partial [Rotaria magnacalcarata]